MAEKFLNLSNTAITHSFTYKIFVRFNKSDFFQVYTTAGMELARVTVSDQDNTAVYETLVKPDSEVVDLNTR